MAPMAGKDEIGYEKPPTLLARDPFDSTSDLAIDSDDDHSSKIYVHRLAPPGLCRSKRTYVGKLRWAQRRVAEEAGEVGEQDAEERETPKSVENLEAFPARGRPKSLPWHDRRVILLDLSFSSQRGARGIRTKAPSANRNTRSFVSIDSPVKI
jgi:hypothetical protein